MTFEQCQKLEKLRDEAQAAAEAADCQDKVLNLQALRAWNDWSTAVLAWTRGQQALPPIGSSEK